MLSSTQSYRLVAEPLDVFEVYGARQVAEYFPDPVRAVTGDYLLAHRPVGWLRRSRRVGGRGARAAAATAGEARYDAGDQEECGRKAAMQGIRVSLRLIRRHVNYCGAVSYSEYGYTTIRMF